MKFNVVFFMFNFLVGYSSHSQTVFHKMYPGVVNEIVFRQMGFINTHDNGYLLGGAATLMKLDSSGTKEWRIHFNWPVNPEILVYSIINDYNQGYMLSGSRMLISLDSTCSINWFKELSSIYRFYITGSKKTDSLSFFYSGLAAENSGVYTPCILKSDSSGNIQWAKIYQSNPVVPTIASADVASDGSMYVCGTVQSLINLPAIHFDGVVFKVNPDGTVQWAKRYAQFGIWFGFNKILATGDGNLIVTGTRSTGRFLMKLDSSGNIIWQKLYSVGVYGNGFDVITTHDNGYLMVGEVTDTSIFGGLAQTSLFIKTDSLGNLEWARYLGELSTVSSSKVVQMPDKGFAAAGRRLHANGYSFKLVKTDSLGNTGGCLEMNPIVTVTNINDTVINFTLTDSTITVTTVPFSSTYPQMGSEVDMCNVQGHSEHENQLEFNIFPNPNSGAFTLRLRNPLYQSTSFELYDMIGKLVYAQNLLKGSETYNIHLQDQIPAGVYIGKLTSADKSNSIKIMIIGDH